MSLKNRLRSAIGTKKGAEVPWVMSGRTVYLTDSLDQPSMSRDTAMKISTVNRCVEVLSTSMAVLPLYIVNEQTHQRVNNHALGNVLWARPCPNMTPFDYARLMAANELLNGNAYAWIVRDQRSGSPKELIPLDPARVTVVQEASGLVWYRYSDPLSGDLYRIDQEDMIHYKGYSVDGVKGISVLRRAATTLETSQAADRYERAIYRNGGQPSGVLTTDADLSERTVPIRDKTGNVVARVPGKDHIRNEWEKLHRGPDNAMRLAVLDHGLKYQPISMSGADLQFVENKDVRVADICRFFGVPLHLVYAGKQSYASNEQNGIEYVNYTLLGYERQWDQEDTYKLLLPSERRKGERVKRELKVFLQGDTAAQANWMKTMREIGAYNADEIRALDDRPPAPGGEEYYASLNYVPQSEWKELTRTRNGAGAVETKENSNEQHQKTRNH